MRSAKSATKAGIASDSRKNLKDGLRRDLDFRMAGTSLLSPIDDIATLLDDSGATHQGRGKEDGWSAG